MVRVGLDSRLKTSKLNTKPMSKVITTFKQIKEIIEPIPADQFRRLSYQDDFTGQCCFLGHIQKHVSGDARQGSDVYGAGFGARALTMEFFKEAYGIFASGASVNDSENVNGYNEPIIKDRLMHMIQDGIKWEENKLKLETT